MTPFVWFIVIVIAIRMNPAELLASGFELLT